MGAGPAGLTAAYELLTKTDIKPIIIEADNQPGGISKTVNYKGNLIDIGGHRFFSKSKKIIDWWLQFLPLMDADASANIHLGYQNKSVDFTPGNISSEKARGNMVLVPRRKLYFFCSPICQPNLFLQMRHMQIIVRRLYNMLYKKQNQSAGFEIDPGENSVYKKE